MRCFSALAIVGIFVAGQTQLASAQDRWARPEPVRHAYAPAASLGRPMPAATLGQPRILTNTSENDIHTAGYLNGRPVLRNRVEAAPMLSPIPTTGPILTDAPPPAPIPSVSSPPANSGASGALAASPYCESCGPVDGGAPMYGDGYASMGDYAGYGPWWTRIWVSAELLTWWVKNATSPPLVFAAPIPAGGGPPVLGTEVALFTGASLYPQFHLGGRFGSGLWFDPNRMHGIDSSFFFLGTRSTNQTFLAPAGQILVRRIIDASNGNVPVLAETATTMTVSGFSQLFGGDINYRRVLCNDCEYRLDLLLGFKYLNLHEQLRLTETGTGVIPGFGVATGTGIDEFATTNNFYGGQIGIRGERHFGRFYAEGYGKIAFGTTEHRIAVSGGQTFLAPQPPPSGLPGNLAALDSNIGIFNATSFSVVPEVGLNIGFHLTPRMRVFVGYTFLYWSNVMRPGDQIDTRIQPNRFPYVNLPPVAPPVGQEPHPVVQFRRTDFWAQGLNFGLQLKW